MTRSSLHRFFQQHGINQLPKPERTKLAKKKFKPYPIGHCHVDMTNVRTEEGKHHLLVVINRTSKFGDAERHEKSNHKVASDFLSHFVKMLPYKMPTVLTDHGASFCVQPRDRYGATARFSRHMCQIPCDEHGIEHCLIQLNHPLTSR